MRAVVPKCCKQPATSSSVSVWVCVCVSLSLSLCVSLFISIARVQQQVGCQAVKHTPHVQPVWHGIHSGQAVVGKSERFAVVM